MADIARPVTLRSESFPAVRVFVDPTPDPLTRGGIINGSIATRAEHTTGWSHDFTDASGTWVATAHCSPEVAQTMLAALNATDPQDAPAYHHTPASRSHEVQCRVAPGGRLQPPPHLLDGEGDASAPAVDMDRLTQVFLAASHDLTQRGAVQSGIRAVLAALGLEVQHGS